MARGDEEGERYADLRDQEVVDEVLSEYHGRRILDVGSGRTVGLVEAAPEDNEVVQVDRERKKTEAVQEKRQTYEERTPSHTAQADATEMPFPKESFDVVFLGHALKPARYAYDEERGMPDYWEEDLGRVLKEGGDLIVQQQGQWNMSLEEMLAVTGMEYRREAFDDVEKHGSVLVMKGYHHDRDPGEPSPGEKEEIALKAARIQEAYFDYDAPGSTSRHPVEAVRGAIEEGRFREGGGEEDEDDGA